LKILKQTALTGTREGNMREMRVLALAMVLFACTPDRPLSPDASDIRPDFMTREGCEQTPGCGPGEDEEEDYPSQPGYQLASMVTPQLCFATSTVGLNANGGGINDLDLDGLDDNCERSLADAFRPHFVFNPTDCNIGGAPHWAAKYFPKAGVNLKPTVRIIYMAAYYQDCGVPNLGSTFACNFGPAADPCSGHYGDSEFVTLDVRYHAPYNRWYVAAAFLTAHYRALGGETSREVVTCIFETCAPVMYRRKIEKTNFQTLFYSRVTESRQLRWVSKVGGKPLLFAANGKHGSYPDYNTCNSGGAYGYDSCEGSSLTSTGVSLFFSGNRNVGSWHRPILDLVTLPGNIFQTGTEWFWNPSRRFFGWMPQHDEQGSDPYYNALTRRFECYALPEDRSPQETAYCYRGLVRS
jgi:hypothetical protein